MRRLRACSPGFAAPPRRRSADSLAAARRAMPTPSSPDPRAGGEGEGADGDDPLPGLPGPVDRRQRRRAGRRHARAGPRADRRRREAGAIRAWLVERYGDWVSYEPPVEPLTWPLWARAAGAADRPVRGWRAAASGGRGGLMGWVFAILHRRWPALVALWRFARLDRAALQFLGAALLLALAGYAWQGHPAWPGAPHAAARTSRRCPTAISKTAAGSARPLRQCRLVADPGRGLPAERRYPGGGRDHAKRRCGSIRTDADLWVGYGNALVIHGGGLMSPAAEMAFNRAAAIAPNHPGAQILLRPRAGPGRQISTRPRRSGASCSPRLRPTSPGAR